MIGKKWAIFYNILKQSSSPIRYGLTFLCVGLPAGGWYIFFFNPTVQALSDFQAQKQTLEAKKTKLLRFMHIIKQQQAAVETFEKELLENKRLLKRPIPVLLEKILLLFKKHQLSLETWKLVRQAEFFGAAIQEYCGMVAGSYKNIVQFFFECEILFPAITCLKAELQKKDTNIACTLSIQFLAMQRGDG